MKKLCEIGHDRGEFDLETETTNQPDITQEDFWHNVQAVWDYTELPAHTLYNLYCAVRYLVAAKIAGDFVECGVLLGGSVMMSQLVLARHERASRRVYALDTFSGFVTRDPELDIDLESGEPVGVVEVERYDHSEAAMENIHSIRYPYLDVIKGDVIQTIPKLDITRIALLCLDTVTYETTRFELESLYDRVVQGGVIIVYDYGYAVGCKKAVDDFLAKQAPVMMQRINKNVRCWIKP